MGINVTKNGRTLEVVDAGRRNFLVCEGTTLLGTSLTKEEAVELANQILDTNRDIERMLRDTSAYVRMGDHILWFDGIEWVVSKNKRKLLETPDLGKAIGFIRKENEE